jgi:hypothetical protein
MIMKLELTCTITLKESIILNTKDQRRYTLRQKKEIIL